MDTKILLILGLFAIVSSTPEAVKGSLIPLGTSEIRPLEVNN